MLEYVVSHSQMGHYFFSYLLTWVVDLIRDYGSNVAIYHFLKPETNKGDFRLYFELVQKSCWGHSHSKILKRNTKTLICSIWTCSQGSLGCQKMRQGPLNKPFEVWCTSIAPKSKNIFKKIYICKRKLIFWHPWNPWERIHIDLNKNCVRTGCV